jgi:glycosyltransferase involved in cell wall biosynthesis
MFCSIIVPTIGRSTLGRSVNSVLEQSDLPDSFEVVVVNDSGKPLRDEEWQQDPQVRVITTQKRNLCMARNSGAAIARGHNLLFLDDDDWLRPGALRYFWELFQEYPNCDCFYGSFELVDDENHIIARYSLPDVGNVAAMLVSGLWMQVSSILIRADSFFAVGGFSPQFIISEDIDLFNRLAMQGDFVGRDEVVSQISRGRNWKTSVDYSDVYEFNRLSRDRILGQPGAFQRLQESASNSYWHGRILRLYIVSMLWNWRRKKRFFISLSRGIFVLRSMLSANRHLFTKEYWQAVSHDLPDTSYLNPT